METKIFNRALALIAVITISAHVFAQDTLPAPPLPPNKLNNEFKEFKFDKDFKFNKEFDKSAFKLKMADMNKQLAAMSNKLSKQMLVKMKGFDQKFKEQFKDFGKDFSGSFSGMVPDLKGNPGSFNNNSSLSDEEYKKKIASGEITEKIKNYSKSYSVDGNDLLQISNTFGKIVVNTWTKSEFKVDVQMKFSSENEESVTDMINGSSISDSKVGSTVSFKTNIYHSESKRNGNNQHIEINYTVYMPAGNPLEISNKFGSVTLPDLSGKAIIKVQFGSLIAQRLSNTANDISISFSQGNSSSIEMLNGGKLKVQYSNFRVGTLNNIDGDFGFSGIDIDRLKGSADLSVKYGKGLNIGTIDKSAKNINISSQFAKVNLDLKDSDDFDFDVTSKMGGFDNNSNKAKVTSKSPSDEDRGWSSTKNYKGYVGKSNSDNKIVITASFGKISFN